jgi:23S rRNA (adenine2503-C2)-methyltransferase
MNIKSMTLVELTEALKALGQPAFRGKQVYTWLHKGVGSYEEMTNLPKSLRDALAEKYPLHIPKVVRKQESQKDGTIKYLWQLSDGNCVETVLMRYHYGNTVCISTEVGCAMGCAFCASTIGGLVRRLEPFEMLDEVLFTQLDSGLPISHIVLMGIGEPLDNFDNVLRFLELVNSPEGMNISMRHISLSTCGLIPKIDALAEKKLQISLAVSLHGPNNEIRSKIMPVNKAYPIEDLLDACRRYYAATSRRIHFEYAMIDGVNDRSCDAKELLRRLKGLPAHINMIPLNHVEESPLKPSTKAAVAAFQKILEEGGITATVRRTLGGDIDASCGQLRRKYNKEKPKD